MVSAALPSFKINSIHQIERIRNRIYVCIGQPWTTQLKGVLTIPRYGSMNGQNVAGDPENLRLIGELMVRLKRELAHARYYRRRMVLHISAPLAWRPTRAAQQRHPQPCVSRQENDLLPDEPDADCGFMAQLSLQRRRQGTLGSSLWWKCFRRRVGYLSGGRR